MNQQTSNNLGNPLGNQLPITTNSNVQQQQPLFGGNNTQVNSLASNNNLFGKVSNASNVSNGLFQQNQPVQNQHSNNSFTFGAPQQQSQPSIFGQIQPQQQVQPSLFGPSQVQPQQQVQPSLFGQVQVQPRQQVQPSLFGPIQVQPQQHQQPSIFQNIQPQSNISNVQPVFQGYTASSPYANYSAFSSGNYYMMPEQEVSSRLHAKDTFNDDQVIQTQPLVPAKTTQEDIKIEIDVKAVRQEVRMGQSVTIPGICSFLTEGGTRTNADIICVIDQSGSMSGKKIALVRETMKYVLNLLNPNDRLSVIVYENQGQRITPFKCANKQNFNYFTNVINNLKAGGGNIMINGLQIALKVIRQRKYRNQATAVFLLSDGQQPKNTAQTLLKRIQLPENKNLGSFSIHSFGFGADHDQDVMSSVSAIKDGNFYYIKQIQNLDEAFVNALGGIMTQTASEIQIKVENIASDLAEGIQISKVYGNKWEKVNDKEYKIQLNQVMSEVSKDFVFQLKIPKIKAELLDINRKISVIRASYKARDTKGNIIKGQALLNLTLIGEFQQFKIQESAKVLEQYYRFKAVEAMEICRTKAAQGQYNEAQKQIENMLETIKTNPIVRKQKMQNLIKDLQTVKANCSPQVYQFDGNKNMLNMAYNHSNQASYAYSNNCQTSLFSALQTHKAQPK